MVKNQVSNGMESMGFREGELGEIIVIVISKVCDHIDVRTNASDKFLDLCLGIH
jgi:hypothetical protein